MALASGTTLGPYEVVAPLGAGGMGEVYRALDSRLDRTVAIKILPTHLSNNAEAKQRFDREARSISSLSHPNICHLYDVGQQDGIDYLVMEFLEGQTLADRLRKGSLPLEQVLKYGIEICEGLDKAHRNGVIHRDLKPSNIMLTKSGVKLMDFGLAKPAPTAVAAPSAATIESIGLTGRRTMVGTVGYMSPEQIQGNNIDTRSDIFALGAVLYEMLTGRRAFEGSSDISVLSAILDKQPKPIAELQPLAPASLDEAVQACLAKDPDGRWQSARDLVLVLRGILRGPAKPAANRRISHTVAGVGVLLLAAVAVGSLMLGLRLRNQPPGVAVRLQIAGPAMFFLEQFESVSPNGRYVAFTGHGSETEAAPQPPMVWVRPLNASKMMPLRETEGAGHHFWSPDSRYIAFFANGLLRKIPVEGGTPQVVCNAPGMTRGTWGQDGTILYTARDVDHPALLRVPASGGTPTPIKLSDERGSPMEYVSWPYFLPDSEHFLFRAASGDIYVGSIRTGASKRLVSSESRAEYSSGYLFYIREGNLVAQRFDDSKLQVGGEPMPVAAGVRHSPVLGSANYSVAAGALSYQAGPYRVRLVLQDRTGRVLKEIARGEFGAIRVSRDGRRVATQLRDPASSNPDIWIYDLDRDTGLRFASHPGGDWEPVWSPDGHELLYSSLIDAIGPPHLYRQSLDGSPPELLLPSDGRMQRPTDWSPDSSRILYTDERPECFACVGLGDTWILSLRDGKKNALLQTADLTGQAQFSPDGKWIAFVQMQSNGFGVYVVPVGGGERQRVSVGGGITPRWSGDGKELFYQSMDSFEYMSVPAIPGATLRFGKPLALFARDPLDFREFDVLPDGQRLVTRVPLPGTQEAPPTTVVLNWHAELK